MIIDKIWKTIFSYLPTQKPTVINNHVTIKPSVIRNNQELPKKVQSTAKITPEQLKLMSPTCEYNYIAPALDRAAFEFGIVTPREIRHWIAHISVESGYFLHLEENLSYSAQRLVQVWPKRFPTLHDAEAYDRNPRLLANKVYGGRMGNTNPNDGYIYRGRGFVQLTGKENYEKAGKALKIDLINHPDLAANPTDASRIAGWYWQKNNLGAIVAKDSDEVIVKSIQDMYANEDDDLTQGTKAINGGLIGLKERRMELHKAMFIWKD